ncbi:ATP-binding cassette domain-containing protein [uncultured Ruminococcus sp.]|uniref:ATP-binding cassette domain-containing protein n=1 Tax=uncultured Ruminococcus sp. TaxID=165186 RepID=UPI0025E0F874|nr:ATP-binding cassette domain-containing protein [uncultured Ruminococcus sp.]
MREIVLQTKQLTKCYRNFTALDHADMTVYREDIYGLIGRNGAGKTTMMKLVTGLTEPTNGEYSLFGKTGPAAEKEKRRIGCLIENPAFFGNLTAYQNLRYYCYQKGITDLKQIDEALGLVQLTNVRNKKFRTFSLGMKQRLGIAFAVLDNPDLIILDEPINGLDPIGISELRDTFRKLSQERGITLIISSHILSELYAVANRFLFIDKGKVLKEVTKQELDLECSRCLVVKTDDTKKTATILESKLSITDYKVIDSEEIRIYDGSTRPDILNKVLIQNDVSISGIYESGVSLEDYFKQLVGEVQS